MNIPVSLELAKLLKEKGFNEPCMFVYDNWDNIEDWLDEYRDYHRNSERNASVYYSAPSISDVVMWIYDKYNVWIQPYRVSDDDNNYPHFWVEINNNGKIIELTKWFESPKEAYEAAINHTVKNLI